MQLVSSASGWVQRSVVTFAVTFPAARWRTAESHRVYFCSRIPPFFLPRSATDCQIELRTFFPLVCWRGGLVCHEASNCSASMAAERMDALTRRLGSKAQSGRVLDRKREQGWGKGRCFGEGRSLSWGQERGRDRRPNGAEACGKGVEMADAGSLHSRRRLSTGGSEDPLPMVRLPR
jgi:hypothetical protein